jgi:hypothetical protein
LRARAAVLYKLHFVGINCATIKYNALSKNLFIFSKILFQVESQHSNEELLSEKKGNIVLTEEAKPERVFWVIPTKPFKFFAHQM